MWQRRLALPWTATIVMFVLTYGTVIIYGAFCPVDSANLPADVTAGHPIFCKTSAQLLWTPDIRLIF
jgi:hypothetical protein